MNFFKEIFWWLIFFIILCYASDCFSIENKIKKFNKSKTFHSEILIAIAKVESSLNPEAIGDNGKAFGLFQIHKPTAKDMKADTSICSILDIKNNISIASMYLDWIYKNLRKNYWCSISAYNKGIARISERDLQNNCYNHKYVLKVKKNVNQFLLVQNAVNHQMFDR